jgi:hypothetical protein
MNAGQAASLLSLYHTLRFYVNQHRSQVQEVDEFDRKEKVLLLHQRNKYISHSLLLADELFERQAIDACTE